MIPSQFVEFLWSNTGGYNCVCPTVGAILFLSDDGCNFVCPMVGAILRMPEGGCNFVCARRWVQICMCSKVGAILCMPNRGCKFACARRWVQFCFCPTVGAILSVPDGGCKFVRGCDCMGRNLYATRAFSLHSRSSVNYSPIPSIEFVLEGYLGGKKMTPFSESTAPLSHPFSEPHPSNSSLFYCRKCDGTFKMRNGAVQHNENRCRPPSKRKENNAESRRKQLDTTIIDNRGEVFTLNRIDENSKFSCPRNCGTTSTRGDVIKRHLKACGVDNPLRFPCPRNCGTTFARPDPIRPHVGKSCKRDSGTFNQHQIDLQVQQTSYEDPQELSESTLVGAVSSTEFASGTCGENPECRAVIPERQLNVRGGSRYWLTPTLTETSVNPASPVRNFHGNSTLNYSPQIEISPNSAHVDIMRRWDLMHANPTYEVGKEGLEFWLSDQFQPLQEGYVAQGNFSLEAPIKFDQVLEDSLIAYGKRDRTRLRIWNRVLRKVEDASVFLRIVSSRFQNQSTAYGNANEPRCLSVFGMKATEKGILASGPYAGPEHGFHWQFSRNSVSEMR